MVSILVPFLGRARETTCSIAGSLRMAKLVIDNVPVSGPVGAGRSAVMARWPPPIRP